MAKNHRKPRPNLDERFKFDATPEEVFRRLLSDDARSKASPESEEEQDEGQSTRGGPL